MKIRIEGTTNECDSRFYANRGETVLGRVYVDVVPHLVPLVDVVRAQATRLDRKELDGG